MPTFGEMKNPLPEGMGSGLDLKLAAGAGLVPANRGVVGGWERLAGC